MVLGHSKMYFLPWTTRPIVCDSLCQIHQLPTDLEISPVLCHFKGRVDFQRVVSRGGVRCGEWGCVPLDFDMPRFQRGLLNLFEMVMFKNKTKQKNKTKTRASGLSIFTAATRNLRPSLLLQYHGPGNPPFLPRGPF